MINNREPIRWIRMTALRGKKTKVLLLTSIALLSLMLLMSAGLCAPSGSHEVAFEGTAISHEYIQSETDTWNVRVDKDYGNLIPGDMVQVIVGGMSSPSVPLGHFDSRIKAGDKVNIGAYYDSESGVVTLYGKAGYYMMLLSGQPSPDHEPTPKPTPVIQEEIEVRDLIPDRQSPQPPGSIITWTADCTQKRFCKGCDPGTFSEMAPMEILYKFRLKGPATGNQWQDKTGWTSQNTWNWITTRSDAGDNSVGVDAKGGNAAAKLESPYSITEENRPPSATDLSSNLVSPQTVGSAIIWTASASDQDIGDPIYYKFMINNAATKDQWQEMTGWSTSRTWTWSPKESDIGDNYIAVAVRDGNHAAEDDYDDFKQMAYTISKENQPPKITNIQSDPTSPQKVGSAITWTASASDPDSSDTIYYKFMINNNATNGQWQETKGWSDSSSWTWSPTSSDIGNNSVGVFARDGKHAPEDDYDSYLGDYFDIIEDNQPPKITNIQSDPTSPQKVGSAITWTASASDPDSSDTIYYKFMIKNNASNDQWQEMRGWSNSSSWTWTPTSSDIGKSSIGVFARDGMHATEDDYDSYMGDYFDIIKDNQPPKLNGVKADPSSPEQAGTPVTWTADALDPDSGDTIYYKFMLSGPGTNNQYQDKTGWITTSTWTWNPSSADAGRNSIDVLIRDGKHAPESDRDAHLEANFEITKENLPPTVTSLTPDQASPQKAGSTIIWTAKASDPENDTIEYQFTLEGKVAADWSNSNTWLWSPGQSDIGDHSIGVCIRDGHHAGSDGCDNKMSAAFTIKSKEENKPPIVSDLSSDVVSPQKVGSSITFTVTASDPENDGISYKYWKRGPATGGTQIQEATDWIKSKTWCWTPINSDVGQNEIGVWIRDGKHANESSYDGAKSVPFAIQQGTDKGGYSEILQGQVLNSPTCKAERSGEICEFDIRVTEVIKTGHGIKIGDVLGIYYISYYQQMEELNRGDCIEICGNWDGKIYCTPDDNVNAYIKKISCPGESRPCDTGWTGGWRCDNNVIEKEYVKEDCSTEWKIYDDCNKYNPPRHCENGECVENCRDVKLQGACYGIVFSGSRDNPSYILWTIENIKIIEGDLTGVEKADVEVDGSTSGYYDKDINPADRVEVFGCYKDGKITLKESKYYIKKFKSDCDEVKFNGTCLEVKDMFWGSQTHQIYPYWIIRAEGHEFGWGNITVYAGVSSTKGDYDPSIAAGDRVEVFGCINGSTLSIMNKTDYYIKKIGPSVACQDDHPPVLTDGKVNLMCGQKDKTLFNFSVIYKDENGDEPDNAAIRIIGSIGPKVVFDNGYWTQMKRISGDPITGILYSYDTTLPADAGYNFWFNFNNKKGCGVFLPPRGFTDDNGLAGPTVGPICGEEILFNGTAVKFHKGNLPGAPDYWTVKVNQPIINGPQPCNEQLDVTTSQAINVIWGYNDTTIQDGDQVEVYGSYRIKDDGTCNVVLYGSSEYYIKKIQTSSKSNYYAILIGVSDGKIPADNDAKAFRNGLLASANWKDDNICILLNNEALKNNIISKIETYFGKAGQNDVCLFFFSGHGLKSFDPTDPRGYKGVLDTWGEDDLYDYELAESLQKLKCKNIAIIINSCHSGALTGMGWDGPNNRNYQLDAPGSVTITTCTADQESKASHPYFDKIMLVPFYIIQGLWGVADENHDERVSMKELFNYMEPRVSSFSNIIPKSLIPSPQLIDRHNGDFNILFLSPPKKIQKMINDAKEGDTLEIPAGSYNEHVIINKPLLLIGQNVVIHAEDDFGCIFIKSDDVTIKGFTLEGGMFGIYLDYHDSHSINDNILTGNMIGLYSIYSNKNKISDNKILASSIYSSVLYTSNWNDIKGENEDKVFCSEYSDNNNLNKGEFREMQLIWSKNNKILNNEIEDIRFITSDSNLIYHNIISVAWNIQSNNIWDDGYPSGGNFWSSYKGIDTNKDGIGDTPFEVDGGGKDNYPLMMPNSNIGN